MPQTRQTNFFTLLIYPESLDEIGALHHWKDRLGLKFRDWKMSISPCHAYDLRDASAIRKEFKDIAGDDDADKDKVKNAFDDDADDEAEEAKANAKRALAFADDLDEMTFDEKLNLSYEYEALKKRSNRTSDQDDRLEFLKQFFKKPHYHVIVDTQKPTTGHNVRRRINRYFGIKIPQVQILKDVFGMYQYFPHTSYEAVKAQKRPYAESEIVNLNGFDIADYETLDTSAYNALATKIFDAVCRHSYTSYVSVRNAVPAELGITTRDFDAIMRTRMPQLNAVMMSMKNPALSTSEKLRVLRQEKEKKEYP